MANKRTPVIAAEKLTLTAKTSYETKVISEAIQRAGKNPQLHGHIHEILLRDSINLNPARLVDGKTARLVANPNAKCVDIVVLKAGKVVSRIQAKDTAASIGKTIKQINGGQYQSAQIFGTRETAEAIARNAEKIKGVKVVQSSGISSNITKSLAVRAGASGASGVGNACLQAARGGGAVGAAVSGGVAIAQGIYDLSQGNRDIDEVAVDVAKETAGGALSCAAGAAASTATGAVVATGVAALGASGAVATVAVVAAPVVVALGVGMAVKSAWDWLFD